MKSNFVGLALKQVNHPAQFPIFFQTTFCPKVAYIPKNLFLEEDEGSIVFGQLCDPEMHIVLEPVTGLPSHFLSLLLTSFSFSLVPWLLLFY